MHDMSARNVFTFRAEQFRILRVNVHIQELVLPKQLFSSTLSNKRQSFVPS